MNLVHGYLIDPHRKTIKKVSFDNDDYQNIYPLIRAQCFDIARVAKDVIIFVDDNGWQFKNKYAFKHMGYPQWLCGYGLVMGEDTHGEIIDAPCTLEQLRMMVTFGENIGRKTSWELDK